MDVILMKDYPSLGYMGDRINVKGGYARNFLFPRGIAMEARSSSAKQLEHLVKGILARRAKMKKDAEEFGAKLKALKVEFTLKIGEQGKSFGSVTARDIELALQRDHEIVVNRKQIRLPEPIKHSGVFPVDVKIHAEVVVPLTVEVHFEAPKKVEASSESDATAPRERRARGGKRGGGHTSSRKVSGESSVESKAPDQE